MSLIKSISGIRGTIGGLPGDNFTPIDIMKFTLGFGKWVKSKSKNPKVVIGRDARLSGEMVSRLVVGSLQSIGVNIVDLGLSTTPTVELAVRDEKAEGGIIITASHNPKHWNALKLLNNQGEFISAVIGEEVLRLAEEPNSFEEISNLGNYRSDDTFLDQHIEKILKLKLVDVSAIKSRKFKIAVDAVNSFGGVAIPRLLKALGVEEVIELNCEPNGIFQHNPEPLPENLNEIAVKVKKSRADLGFAVDPDVDRLAIICEDGNMFGEEYTLVAVSDYVLSNPIGKPTKKLKAVSNLSSTRALKDVTERKGGEYFASAVGEVNVVEKMKAVKAVIGGEGNGGIIYPELHFGRDALVGIALFLSHLARNGKTASMLRSSYPNYFMAKRKVDLDPNVNIDRLFSSIEKKYDKYSISTVDGLRIDFAEDWVHLRKSNTEPVIRIYAESNSDTTSNNIANQLISDLKMFSKE